MMSQLPEVCSFGKHFSYIIMVFLELPYDVDDVLREPLYCYETRNIMKSYEDGFTLEKQKDTFAYFLRGELYDLTKKLVKVGGFTLSLEDSPVPKDLMDGDIIEFTVQMLDIY